MSWSSVKYEETNINKPRLYKYINIYIYIYIDRIEDGIDNKVLLQPGNPSIPNPTLEKPLVKLPTTRQASLKPKDQAALRIVAQKLDDLVKKEPITPFSDHTTTSRDPRLESRAETLHAHIRSDSSSTTPSETEREIEH